MKAPQAGGLRALQDVGNSKRKLNVRAAHRFSESLAVLPAQITPLFSHYIGPLAVLALLVTACFTLPLHHPKSTWADLQIPIVSLHGGATALAFWFVANALLLSLATLYWVHCLRAHLDDPRLKRFILRLIFSVPAFAGVMAASVIYGSDLGGHAVAATLGSAGVIASALLVATVIGRSASTITVVMMAAVMGLMDIFPAWATTAAALGAIAGQYPARSIRNRTAVVRCAAFVMAAAGVSALAAALLTGHDFGAACSIGMQALLIGCLGAAIWFTLLTLMERPFQLTTPLGLLELLDPTRPMLERFAREAPGTFAHSLMVGHLAASAAEPIGADPLLCRVAAQYHDIGKLSRAQFFKENQQGNNIHDQLAPSLSAIIVNSHVRDGERMANELGLPPVIRDIITQHHGTTLMRYFFHQAAAGAEPRRADALQYQFRYPGPKPQSKEAGIMMLADAVEAASRTLSGPTRERIREMVDGIVDDRIQDHQLDECPLTLKDIKTIRATLADVVCAMLHQRIEYPAALCADELEGERLALDSSAAFDFYENFDPAVLLASSEAAYSLDSEARRPADYPDASHSSSGGESPGYPAQR